MDKSWRSLEHYVRHIGQILWGKTLLPERIDGVNFDGVEAFTFITCKRG